MASPDQGPRVNGLSISDLGSPAIREARSSPPALPSRADIFISPGSTDLPYDFREPPPFFLDAQEWETYSDRKRIVENATREAITGTGIEFTG